METNGVKIQFSQNHRSMIARPALDLVHGGHLVFNIPRRLPESHINKTAITDEVVNDVYPFFSLNIKNQAELFKVGASFIADIGQGRKQFGFASLFKESNEKHLLAYGSFINYKNPKFPNGEKLYYITIRNILIFYQVRSIIHKLRQSES